MTKLMTRHEEDLFDRVAQIIEAARAKIARSVNSAMVHAYWLIGREIIEVEQHGQKRAGYGEELMDRLAERLTTRYGKGFGPRTLRRMRLFYLTFPKGSALLSDPSVVDKWTAPVSNSRAATFGQHCCSDKNDAVVKITLPEDNRQVHAARYQHYLPTEDQLRVEVTRSREEVEHRLQLEAEPAPAKAPRNRPTRRRGTRRKPGRSAR